MIEKVRNYEILSVVLGLLWSWIRQEVLDYLRGVRLEVLEKLLVLILVKVIQKYKESKKNYGYDYDYD